MSSSGDFCVGAVVFSSLSLLYSAGGYLQDIPSAVAYVFYASAAFFLTLAVWGIIRILKKTSAKKLVTDVLAKNKRTARLASDFSYRTLAFASLSLILNIILALSKAIAGWYYGSTWLMVLSGYYMALIFTKFILLGYGRQQDSITEEKAKVIHQWKAYRSCGMLLILVTLFLQGVVIMIIKDGTGFFYNEIVLIAIAAYDFYCLGSAIVYMVTQHKKHGPVVNAIKSLSFASSLVAILSLQTAMLASFGIGIEPALSRCVNAATGTAVCLFLVGLGLFILIKANRELKFILKSTGEVKNDSYISSR